MTTYEEVQAAEAIEQRSTPETVGAMVLDVAAKHSGIAQQFRRGGSNAYVSYTDLGTIASEIARGLIALEIEPGDRVAIIGLTSAEWTQADLGVLCAGAVVTPIYHTNSPRECAYVLAHSDARVVFCDTLEQVAKIEQIRGECPALERIVVFDAAAREGVITLAELRRLGAQIQPEAVQERIDSRAPDDLATLVYTSGTTGPPKGCMLSHRNLVSTARMYAQTLHFNSSHSLYQFLPLA